jgi:hypothetical protein
VVTLRNANKDLLKKFDIGETKPLSTPMSTTTALDADEEGEAMDQKEYRSTIGSLLYLTTTRPDIQFVVCLCALFSLRCVRLIVKPSSGS